MITNSLKDLWVFDPERLMGDQGTDIRMEQVGMGQGHGINGDIPLAGQFQQALGRKVFGQIMEQSRMGSILSLEAMYPSPFGCQGFYPEDMLQTGSRDMVLQPRQHTRPKWGCNNHRDSPRL